MSPDVVAVVVGTAALAAWVAVTLLAGALVRHRVAGAARAAGSVALAAGVGAGLTVASVLVAAVGAVVTREPAGGALAAALAGALAAALAVSAAGAPRAAMRVGLTASVLLLSAGSLAVWASAPVVSVLVAALALLVAVDAWKTNGDAPSRARTA